MPTRTYLLTVDSQVSSGRIAGGRDRMESEDLRFKLRTEAMFLEEMRRDPDRFRVVPTDGTVEQTHAMILHDMQQLLSSRGFDVALTPRTADDDFGPGLR
jgi:thymidylate kinase